MCSENFYFEMTLFSWKKSCLTVSKMNSQKLTQFQPYPNEESKSICCKQFIPFWLSKIRPPQTVFLRNRGRGGAERSGVIYLLSDSNARLTEAKRPAFLGQTSPNITKTLKTREVRSGSVQLWYGSPPRLVSAVRFHRRNFDWPSDRSGPVQKHRGHLLVIS